jgi:hypothetical protein
LSQVAIVYPLLVQVALTLVLLVWMGRLRTDALLNKHVRPEDIALGQPGWPAQTTQVSNSFRNQLEVPVLFYVLALLLLQTRLSDIIQVVLAWLFVLSRIGHAWVHTTTNDVRMRGSLWGIGALIVIVMWIWFAVRLLGASA